LTGAANSAARWFHTKIPIWVILECLAMKDVGKFYGHLVYFTATAYILWPFGYIFGYFGVVFPFWYVEPRKIWQPWKRRSCSDAICQTEAATKVGKKLRVENTVSCDQADPGPVL
jgi:hypothetical protein